MQKYIYLPTGAEVTAPKGLDLPPHMFEPISGKPKPQKADEATNEEAKPKRAPRKRAVDPK